MSEISTPFADVEGLLRELTWERIEDHPESPIEGDVIMYRDGSIAVVTNSAHVSYGAREDMQSVARWLPRPAAEAQGDEEEAHDDERQ